LSIVTEISTSNPTAHSNPSIHCVASDILVNHFTLFSLSLTRHDTIKYVFLVVANCILLQTSLIVILKCLLSLCGPRSLSLGPMVVVPATAIVLTMTRRGFNILFPYQNLIRLFFVFSFHVLSILYLSSLSRKNFRKY
jgi:hypothetical protein